MWSSWSALSSSSQHLPETLRSIALHSNCRLHCREYHRNMATFLTKSATICALPSLLDLWGVVPPTGVHCDHCCFTSRTKTYNTQLSSPVTISYTRLQRPASNLASIERHQDILVTFHTWVNLWGIQRAKMLLRRSFSWGMVATLPMRYPPPQQCVPLSL